MFGNVYLYAVSVRLPVQCVSANREYLLYYLCALFIGYDTYIDGRNGCGKPDERTAVLQCDERYRHYHNP